MERTLFRPSRKDPCNGQKQLQGVLVGCWGSVNRSPQAWCAGGRILPLERAVTTGPEDMDLFCLSPKPVFFSVANVTRPIRNHCLQLEASATVDNSAAPTTVNVNKQKLFGKDSDFIELLVSVFPDV